MKTLIFITILAASSITLANEAKKICSVQITKASSYISCNGEEASRFSTYENGDILAEQTSYVFDQLINKQGMELLTCSNDSNDNTICTFIKNN